MHRLLIALIVLAPVLSRADNHRARDWPEGSAMHTGRVAQENLAQEDKRLNAAYRALLGSLPRDEADHYPRRALIEAQRAWIKYRDTSCAFDGEMTGGARMWKSAHTVICEVEETQKRTLELQKMLGGNH